jgi:predicted TIM-barrel fold metal-dependent hydrolase
VCHHHPSLPVILLDVQGRNNRTLYALLSRFENLHVQTAGLDVHQGLEDLVRRFGPERLVYGSSYPTKTMGGARLQLLRSGLSDADRQLIAADNLDRLLAGVRAKEPVTGGS